MKSPIPTNSPGASTFENESTRQLGMPRAGPRQKIKDRLSDEICAFIGQSPFLVMATSAADGSCDASPKGGRPGWVKILDRDRLLIPDVAGNRLFQSYQNLTQNPQVGLIFFQPGVGDTVRVNGGAEIVDRARLDRLQVQLSVFDPDENARILQGILVSVGEAYTHCPRSANFARLWRQP